MKFVHQIDPSKFLIFPLSDCPEKYMQSKNRQEYFEIIWFSPEHNPDNEVASGSQFVYLIPPFRSVIIPIEDKQGYLIAFKRDYLEEDDKEYALDIFNLFNMQGQYTMLQLDTDTANRFNHLQPLITEEYQNPFGTYLVLKSLLKVFLLNLIRLNQHAFLNQDINQKRVYEFILLMERYYQKERKASFYSDQLGISEKRLNQILKEKMNKTLTQLLHIRLIVEAKRKLISSERTIKEIAYELNFEDRAYFSRFFKKQTGLTAEQFRNRQTN
ncbi:helix-turn-helix domain-containing protein [Pedobacter cryoconitis]|uniref:helix-turn-helix domain-containing protein n=1 Tax=Pedobacter cryoconitis TaxID=188932 RepID=UPI00161F7688|nr:helix-turn-helix domain-containing protein [Pedobacter cryoconitis]MBB5644128.1 AraC-like DNA-binding protein [Pedobacter cryoconitis]